MITKIPVNPISFKYIGGNDPTPKVLILKLMNDEINPGFLGLNLNYIDNQLETIERFREHLYDGTLEKHWCNDEEMKALRRYNYKKIS